MQAPFIDLGIHHQPEGLSDRIAIGFTKTLRWCADTFFAERYGQMVGATINHLACLRRMCDDKGWINELAGLPVAAVAACPPHVALEPTWKQAA